MVAIPKACVDEARQERAFRNPCRGMRISLAVQSVNKLFNAEEAPASGADQMASDGVQPLVTQKLIFLHLGDLKN